MPGGAEVAKAFVTIIPTMQGAQAAITKAMVPGASSAGLAAGKGAGSSMLTTFTGFAKKAAAAFGLVGLGVGVANFVKDSVKAGMEFDAAMSQVAATMGTTTDQIGELRDFAQEMGSTTMFSATQAAEGLNYMALAGYDAQTSMQMLPTVLNLAAAGGMELAAASDMVTDAQSALGLSIEETTDLVDKMAAAASTTNTSVEQLGNAILTIGGTARDMAGGTTELTEALGLLADNGIKGAEGGTALRNIMISFANGKFDKVFGDLGVAAYDAEGNLRPLQDIMLDVNDVMADMSTEERNNLITKAFNARDLKAINALLGTSAERWEEVELAINGAWYTNDLLSASMSDVGLDFDTMAGKLESLGVNADELHEALANSGGDVGAFTDALGDMVNDGVSSEAIIQALGGDLDSLQTAFDETGGAAQAMSETMMDNLEGDVTFFQSALEGFQIAVSDLLDPVLRGVTQLGTGLFSGLTDAIHSEGFTAWLERVGTALEPLKTAFTTLGQAIGPVLSGMGTSMMNTFGSIIEILVGILAPILANVISLVTPVIQFVLMGLQIMWDVLSQFFGWIAANVMPYIQQIFGYLSPYLDQMAAWFAEHMPVIQQTVWAVMTKIGEVMATVWPYVVTIVTAAIGAISRVIGSIGTIVSTVQGIFARVKNAITQPIETARSMLKSIVEKIKSIFSGLKLELPHPKLPHLNVYGGEAPWGIGGLGKKPEFSIDWYAQGGIFTAPTIIGVGEAGTEAVLPLSKLDSMLDFEGEGGDTFNLYINGTQMIKDEVIEGNFYRLMDDLFMKYKLMKGN